MKPATLQTARAIPLLQTLGIHPVEFGEGFAVMTVTVDDRHLNYFGGCHGGLIAALVDTVCFFSRELLPAGRLVTTNNLNIHYVRAAALGDVLSARSTVLHLGKRTVSLRVDVTNQHGEMVAHGSATLTVLKEPAPDSCTP